MFVELFLLVLLIGLVVMVIRGGKPAVLENPIVIQHPGQCHITLAPQLQRAQTFIEKIAGLFANSHSLSADLPGQYFEVRDPDVFAQEGKFYLLAAALRGGRLYFQAIIPQPLLRDSESYLKQVQAFSEAVLAQLPLTHPADGDASEKLGGAVNQAALELNISVKPLTDT